MFTHFFIFYKFIIQESAQPTFPEFSKKIQDVIDDFGAVFIKSNWRTPSVIYIYFK